MAKDYHGLPLADIGTDNTKKILVWPNVVGFILLHVAALYGFYLIFYAKLATVAAGKYYNALLSSTFPHHNFLAKFLSLHFSDIGIGRYHGRSSQTLLAQDI